MTLSKKDEIKYLCNFSEKSHNGSVASISYLDYLEENTLQEQLKAKATNRELAIDIVTGEKEESAWDSRADLPKIDETTIPVMGLKIFSMNVQAKTFTSYEDLHTEIITYIENFTQGQPVLNNGIASFDLTLTNDPSKTDKENFDYNNRRVISKLVSCGNYIAVTNRRGPGTTVLVHPDTCLKYDISAIINNSNYTLVKSDLITKDKFIVLRADLSGTNEDGLFVIKSLDEDKYFMKETPNLKNKIMWFYVK